MNLQAIVDYLNGSGSVQPSYRIFREHMPSEVKDGLLVTSQTPMEINAYSGIRKASFQVIGRGRDVDQVRLLMRGVSEVLTIKGAVLDNMKVIFIRPKHEPLTYPRSEGHLIEASVNFEINYFFTS